MASTDRRTRDIRGLASRGSPTCFDHPRPARLRRSAGLDPARLPRHVAIIMDGNGRWAQQRGHAARRGPRRGRAVASDVIIEECCRLGIGQLTLYCLSTENWKRPQARTRLPDGAAQAVSARASAQKILRPEHPLHGHRPARRACPTTCSREIDENIRLTQRQHRHDAVPGDQLRQPRPRSSTPCGRSPSRCKRGELQPGRHRRGGDRRRAVHRRDAGPGPAHPHRRRDAGQQLPALADLLRRAVGDAEVLAGLRRGRCCTRRCATSPAASAGSAA